MRVYIFGIDGYLGWSLAQYLAGHGHIVSGIDNCARRKQWVPEMGSDSVTPIAPPEKRLKAFKKHFGDEHFSDHLYTYVRDARNLDTVKQCLLKFQPDCIVNLAHMPSAPYAMIDFEHCQETQMNNLTTTNAVIWAVKELMPHVPIVTIGSAGEYGTPNTDIAEGYFDMEYNGRQARVLFPRMTPASFYHASKVASSVNIERACSWWGLTATDIMQSVVYGTRHKHSVDDDAMVGRIDVDQCFGTVANRFVAQAILGHPLTVYGAGTQKRGLLPLRDSMECLRLLIETPPDRGEYRVVNQYDQIHSMNEVAGMVARVGGEEFGLNVIIDHLENPRCEEEDHHYEIERKVLVSLGYEPKGVLVQELRLIFDDMLRHRDRISLFRDAILPTVTWKSGKGKQK